MRADSSIFDANSGRRADASAREAAAWLARRDRGLSAAEEDAFTEWRAADPRNAGEFALLEAEWIRLDQAKNVPDLAAAAWRIDESTRLKPRGRHLPLWGGLAAAAAMAVAALGLWREETRKRDSTPVTYQVVSQATRRLELVDGSVVELNGASQIRTAFTPAIRQIWLLQGEAHFIVAKNPKRPFIVVVGPASVRAVGTAFDIRLTGSSVQVLVTDGKVNIENTAAANFPQTEAAAPLLAAGQRALIAGGSTDRRRPDVIIDSPSPAQIERIMAWRSTWLIFKNTPLEDAVDAFNRHGSQRMALDPALRGRRLGGRFRADNIESFVWLLQQGSDVKVERRNGVIVLSPAN